MNVIHQFERFNLSLKVILITSIICFPSCYDDCLENNIEVPEELLPYYERFFKEANTRGVFLNEQPVTFEYGDESSVLGKSDKRDCRIIFNPGILSMNEVNIEYVVFHEMGHYLLDLKHDNSLLEDPIVLDTGDTIPRGSVSSIMHSKRVAYTVGKEEFRDYYLDKLFAQKTDF